MSLQRPVHLTNLYPTKIIYYDITTNYQIILHLFFLVYLKYELLYNSFYIHVGVFRICDILPRYYNLKKMEMSL